MTGPQASRFAFAAAAALAGLFAQIAVAPPAVAQLFDERFPFFEQRPGRLFQPPWAVQRPQPPADYSRAPPPKKTEKAADPDVNTVVVMGDSMADWLAYGLELAFAESPEIAIVRKHRTYSSLIYTQGRHEVRNRNIDWPNYAREILAKESPSFVVFMIGLGDREPIREPKVQAKPAAAKLAAPAQGAADAKPDAQKPADEAVRGEDAQAPTAAEERGTGTGTAEFKSDRWTELYAKRVDDTIAALKAKGVPVIWVGLPPVRGAKSMAEIAYLNEVYRARAEKTGITYVDVWDGFVDDGGRFAQQGPDLEGQTRRLRTSDGTHFTQFGARKLAHYVEKEIRRALTHSGVVAVPLPVENEQPQAAALSAPAPGTATPRPMSGPVVPLNALGESREEDLAGGAASSARQTLTDAVAARVLIRGEAMPAPAGRADDFIWPRRGVAPVGADPAATIATLPMTPMVTDRPPATKAVAAAPARSHQATQRAAQAAPRPPGAVTRQHEVRRYYQQQPPPFFFFFGR